MKKLAIRLPILLVSLFAALLILPATAQAVTYPGAVDSTNFPDAAWREHVNTAFAGDDYVLTQAEANVVTFIDASNLGIADLTGIEYFQNLTLLGCNNNLLTSLYLTGLTKVRDVVCSNNSLASLDITGLLDLRQLICGNNFLTALDVSSNPSLVSLDCNSNLLTSLNVASQTQMQSIDCSSNSLLEIIGVDSNVFSTALHRQEQFL